MAYAIGYFVYGINLEENTYDGKTDAFKQFRDEFEELRDMDASQVTGEKYSTLIGSAYNGNGDEPLWFGISTGEIDECNSVSGSEVQSLITVTDEHKEKYTKLLAMLKEEATPALYDAIAAIEPSIFVTWGTS